MSEHTEGKLEIIGEQGTALWAGALLIATMYEPRTRHALARANARRLVACWNACEGIPTEDLESKVVVGFMADLKRQRDELVEALFNLRQQCEWVDGTAQLGVEEIDALLAKHGRKVVP
jgi:hypothetical protein